MTRRVAFGALLLALLLSCSTSDSPGSPAPTPAPTPGTMRYAPTVLPPLADAPTTKDRTWVVKTPRADANTDDNPSLLGPLADYLGRGFGDIDPGPGDDYVVRVIDDSTPPAPGANAKRLAHFIHMADLQLSDDESPTRLASFDGPASTSSALRPQDPDICRMVNACVRTINALHGKDPFAFTLMGGDNADSAQSNEVDWVLSILSGADSVECDSGNDDDIIPGPDNDGKDPFKADGLKMPWKWVTGNHDTLVQGNLVTTDDNRAKALDIIASGGTRRYDDDPKGRVERGDFVVADPRRALLSGKELMAKVGGHADGHGIGQPEKDSGRATYFFDVDGTNLRFVVIDTSHPEGGSEGMIGQGEIDRVIKKLLDDAKTAGKWVILSSHHSTASLGDGSGLGGQVAPDALTQAQWEAFVGGYDNVVFSMVGHSHRHRVSAIKPTGGHAWWEIMTSAIADYPHQFRIIEIFDQDNGWLMMRATAVDFVFDDDPVAALGKKRGIVDFTSGWLPHDLETAPDKNVEVWIKKPGAG